jgi:hypothetical protein
MKNFIKLNAHRLYLHTQRIEARTCFLNTVVGSDPEYREHQMETQMKLFFICTLISSPSGLENMYGT